MRSRRGRSPRDGRRPPPAPSAHRDRRSRSRSRSPTTRLNRLDARGQSTRRGRSRSPQRRDSFSGGAHDERRQRPRREAPFTTVQQRQQARAAAQASTQTLGSFLFTQTSPTRPGRCASSSRGTRAASSRPWTRSGSVWISERCDMCTSSPCRRVSRSSCSVCKCSPGLAALPAMPINGVYRS